MARSFHFEENEFYHVYNRGIDKRTIFLDDAGKRRFLKLLYLCNSSKPVNLRELPKGETFVLDRGKRLVDVCAYCMMDNHFHLLLKEFKEGGLSLFMQKISTAYVMYFNERCQRTGALFEGSFRAKHVDNDRYLHYLLAYLHLNPVDMVQSGWKENGIKDLVKAKSHLEKYPYSSYFEFTGRKRPERAVINKSSLPKYFSTSIEFGSFLVDWLSMPKGSAIEFD